MERGLEGKVIRIIARVLETPTPRPSVIREEMPPQHE
jgi:hypothetical protein